MAVNQWRLERVWSFQTATVDEESANQQELVEAKYEDGTPRSSTPAPTTPEKSI